MDVRFEGGREHSARIRALAAHLQDLRPFWPLVRRAWIGWVSRTFESEGAFLLGHRWEDLAPSYRDWKARYFPGKPILSMMGPLRRAATTPRQIVSARSLELVVEPYDHPPIPLGAGRSMPGRTLDPAWFQDGTTRMPARPLAATGPEMLTAGMRDELHRIGTEYADDLARRLRLI